MRANRDRDVDAGRQQRQVKAAPPALPVGVVAQPRVVTPAAPGAPIYWKPMVVRATILYVVLGVIAGLWVYPQIYESFESTLQWQMLVILLCVILEGLIYYGEGLLQGQTVQYGRRREYRRQLIAFSGVAIVGGGMVYLILAPISQSAKIDVVGTQLAWVFAAFLAVLILVFLGVNWAVPRADAEKAEVLAQLAVLGEVRRAVPNGVEHDKHVKFVRMATGMVIQLAEALAKPVPQLVTADAKLVVGAYDITRKLADVLGVKPIEVKTKDGRPPKPEDTRPDEWSAAELLAAVATLQAGAARAGQLDAQVKALEAAAAKPPTPPPGPPPAVVQRVEVPVEVVRLVEVKVIVDPPGFAELLEVLDNAGDAATAAVVVEALRQTLADVTAVLGEPIEAVAIPEQVRLLVAGAAKNAAALAENQAVVRNLETANRALTRLLGLLKVDAEGADERIKALQDAEQTVLGLKKKIDFADFAELLARIDALLAKQLEARTLRSELDGARDQVIRLTEAAKRPSVLAKPNAMPNLTTSRAKTTAEDPDLAYNALRRRIVEDLLVAFPGTNIDTLVVWIPAAFSDLESAKRSAEQALAKVEAELGAARTAISQAETARSTAEGKLTELTGSLAQVGLEPSDLVAFGGITNSVFASLDVRSWKGVLTALEGRKALQGRQANELQRRESELRTVAVANEDLARARDKALQCHVALVTALAELGWTPDNLGEMLTLMNELFALTHTETWKALLDAFEIQSKELQDQRVVLADVQKVLDDAVEPQQFAPTIAVLKAKAEAPPPAVVAVVSPAKPRVETRGRNSVVRLAPAGGAAVPFLNGEATRLRPLETALKTIAGWLGVTEGGNDFPSRVTAAVSEVLGGLDTSRQVLAEAFTGHGVEVDVTTLALPQQLKLIGYTLDWYQRKLGWAWDILEHASKAANWWGEGQNMWDDGVLPRLEGLGLLPYEYYDPFPSPQT